MTDETYQLDKTRVRRAFERAAPGYDAVAVLQREVADRLLERLDLVRLTPARVLDLGAGTGYATRHLGKRYGGARVVAVDLAAGMLKVARRRDPWFGRPRYVCGDVERLPFADASVDLLFSSLTLQWCNDLDRVFAGFRRVLRPGGLLMFSTFGPDTLRELRHAWRAVDDYSHVNAFLDMHDVGDALVRAGLAEPVMDVEHLTLTYRDLRGVMTDLKGIGAHNVTAGCRPGLTGKGRLRAATAAYEVYRRADGTLPATYEVVYGHAWAPATGLATRNERGAAAQQVAVVPVEEIGRGKR